MDYSSVDGATTFLTAPFAADTEITGPIALQVWVESAGEELDLFASVINIDPRGQEVRFEDASAIMGAVTKGWLRMSHRALDPQQTLPHRPYHLHAARQPLVPGEPVLAEVEILPTSMVFEAGHRLGLVLSAGDRGEPSRFLHDDDADRAPSRAAGTHTIHTGGDRASFLLLPVIPNSDDVSVAPQRPS